MGTVALLDGDIFAYTAASAGQKTVKFGDEVCIDIDEDKAKEVLEQSIKRIQERLHPSLTVVALSCPTDEGWRKAILPSYKAHRNPAAKPQLLGAMKDVLRNTFRTFEKPTLEADDVMGILSTASKRPFAGEPVIVSIDKDMKTIPGWLFNPAKDTKPKKISAETAQYWHFYQTLVGDATDGYKGCPKVGPVHAERILMWAENDKRIGATLWGRVVNAFESKGLTEEDALLQARVARICHASDYDFERKEVKLWTPTK